MLTIRGEQFSAFAAAMAEPFRHEMAAHLNDAFPGKFEGPNDAALRNLIAGALEKAFRLGFTSRADVRTFLELTAVHGRGFESEEWARAILEDPHLGPQAKIARLDAVSIDLAESEE